MIKKVSPVGIIGWVFLIFGVLFSVFGAFSYVSEQDFKKTALTTNGTIYDIVSYSDSDGDTSYDVYVEFYVDGQLYNGKLNYYYSSMDEGDSLTIYYNPEDPSDFVGDGSSTGLILFVVLGGIFGLVGVGMITSQVIKKTKRKKVMAFNNIIQANITSFDINNNVTVNGRHPYILIATVMSPYDGLIYTFKSDSIWNDMTPLFQNYNITTVPVYVNPQNYKEYYVDIDSFNRYFGN